MAFSITGVTPVTNPAQANDLTCKIMIEKSWGYPTGQVALLCNNAINACLIEGLIKNRMKRMRGEKALKMLQQDLHSASLLARNQLSKR